MLNGKQVLEDKERHLQRFTGLLPEEPSVYSPKSNRPRDLGSSLLKEFVHIPQNKCSKGFPSLELPVSLSEGEEGQQAVPI